MNKDVHPLVQLAHRAVAAHILERRHLSPPSGVEMTAEMHDRAGTFVSLHEFGELRGCIGTFLPQRANVAEEIIENAIASATRDPRFPPVQPDEIDDLEISVDVLTEPEPVESAAELDPSIYGVIVTDLDNFRRGLLLPALEQVKSSEQQLAIARQKAYIGPDEPVRLYRFQVKRYH
jgi:AmmeMemoRadiSam system protein A